MKIYVSRRFNCSFSTRFSIPIDSFSRAVYFAAKIHTKTLYSVLKSRLQVFSLFKDGYGKIASWTNVLTITFFESSSEATYHAMELFQHDGTFKDIGHEKKPSTCQKRAWKISLHEVLPKNPDISSLSFFKKKLDFAMLTWAHCSLWKSKIYCNKDLPYQLSKVSLSKINF